MSLSSVHDLACPECGHKQKIEVWHSVNVSLDPRLREKLLRGEINVFKCRRCRNSAPIETPLLYNDMSRRYCVQYYPFMLIDQPDFLRQFNENAKIDFGNIPKDDLDCCEYLIEAHIVFDLGELVRYVKFRDLVFDANNKKIKPKV